MSGNSAHFRAHPCATKGLTPPGWNYRYGRTDRRTNTNTQAASSTMLLQRPHGRYISPLTCHTPAATHFGYCFTLIPPAGSGSFATVCTKSNATRHPYSKATRKGYPPQRCQSRLAARAVCTASSLRLARHSGCTPPQHARWRHAFFTCGVGTTTCQLLGRLIY